MWLESVPENAMFEGGLRAGIAVLFSYAASQVSGPVGVEGNCSQECPLAMMQDKPLRSVFSTVNDPSADRNVSTTKCFPLTPNPVRCSLYFCLSTSMSLACGPHDNAATRRSAWVGAVKIKSPTATRTICNILNMGISIRLATRMKTQRQSAGR